MRTTAALIPLCAALALSACETIHPLLPPPPEELDLWADAAAGVTHVELADLVRDAWQAELRHDPFRATRLGDPRWNGKIPDTSLEARLAWKAQQEGLLTRLRNLERRQLTPSDRLNAELLREKLENGIAHLALGLEDWIVDPLEGPHVTVLNLATVQPIATERQREQLVQRWKALPSYIRQATRNLQRGRLSDQVASRTAIEKVIHQLDELLAQSPFQSPLVELATGGGRWVPLAADGSVATIAHEHLGDAREQSVLLRLNKHVLEPERTAAGSQVLLPTPGDPLTNEERGAFLYDVLLAVEQGIYPALAHYREVLQQEILPAARDDEHPGLKYLRNGASAYRTLIHEQTSLPLEECDPKAIHEYGLAEVRRIRAEIGTLGQKLFGNADLAAIQQRLRDDPAVHFRTREEVAAKASEALDRARGRMRSFFGILPIAPCEVVPMPAHEEADSTIAYYREPAADGSRPGRYYVNTSAPETRPRYEAEVLAFHEAIPGHHLQAAIAQEREDLPRFRRHGDMTAFVEGWALYTERLSDEMGLYSGDLDRLGMLSYDAWRASRLVVDTGIHAFGWSREEAIEFLYENTLLARNNVENEVDRYIAWPAQALAYKIGQREILALRDQARTALGARFNYPEFHDHILQNGAVTLAALRSLFQDWIGQPDREPIEALSPRR